MGWLIVRLYPVVGVPLAQTVPSVFHQIFCFEVQEGPRNHSFMVVAKRYVIKRPLYFSGTLHHQSVVLSYHRSTEGTVVPVSKTGAGITEEVESRLPLLTVTMVFTPPHSRVLR